MNFQSYDIINIYAPAINNEKQAFWTNVGHYLHTLHTSKLILGGDLNHLITDYNRTGGITETEKLILKIIEPIMEKQQIIDIYRKFNDQ